MRNAPLALPHGKLIPPFLDAGAGQAGPVPVPARKSSVFPGFLLESTCFLTGFSPNRYVGGLSKPVDSFKIHKEYDYGTEAF